MIRLNKSQSALTLGHRNYKMKDWKKSEDEKYFIHWLGNRAIACLYQWAVFDKETSMTHIAKCRLRSLEAEGRSPHVQVGEGSWPVHNANNGFRTWKSVSLGLNSVDTGLTEATLLLVYV
jgi:hypothetical protein